MALIEFKIELGRLVRAVERIADCLEREYPAPKVPVGAKPTQPEDLIQFDPEEEWEREIEEERQRNLGLLPGSQRR